MKEQATPEVLICGAGAAGLTLAIDLARRGVPFRLIDKMDAPFGGSRGKGIQPRTQEIFEDLGIQDRVAAAGGIYPPMRQYRPDGGHTDIPVVEAANATPAEPHRTPLLIPQFLTEEMMRERLAELGHRPEFGCALEGFEQDDDGVTAHLLGAEGAQTLRVRWLVGADGGRSLVRHALGIGFPGKTLGVRAVVADTILTGLARDAWHRYNDGDMARQLMLCPLAGTGMFQLQGPVPLEGEIDLSAAGLTALIGERTGRTDIRVESVSWASAYTMNARLAERYRAGRVFLAGDAAHIHPPTGGQGLNTSVQDAYNLGWKLAAVIHGAPAALLDTYEEERRPVAAEMLGLATRLLTAQNSGPMRRGREVTQLDIGYPGSSLTLADTAAARALAAGARAPDAPLRGAAGQPIRLFDVLKGPHWTLLGYQASQVPVAVRAGLHIHIIGPDGDIRDDRGCFKDAYQLEAGDWALIRPDGYIAAILASTDTGLLDGYLARVGLTGRT